MKNFFVVFSLVILVFCSSTTLHSLEGKEINLFANVGIASKDIEGFFLDVGAELQLTKNLFAQMIFDYYPEPYHDLEVEGIDYSMMGISLYAVLKMPASESLSFFAKAGIHSTTLKTRADVSGIDVTLTDSNFGVGGGLGIEYYLNERMGLTFGGTVKAIFAEKNERATWFKMYGGFSYRIR